MSRRSCTCSAVRRNSSATRAGRLSSRAFSRSISVWRARGRRGRSMPNLADYQQALAIYTLIAYHISMGERIGITVAETEHFIRSTSALWSSTELDAFKDFIAFHPLAGDAIPGTGGLRKLRWARAGLGKRGGVRVIYYFYDA